MSGKIGILSEVSVFSNRFPSSENLEGKIETLRQDEVTNLASEEAKSKVFPKNTGAVANSAYRTWGPRLRLWIYKIAD